jgi:hypothetical protein
MSHSSGVLPQCSDVSFRVQVADDQGYANIGYHNNTMLMPRIDEIAKAGVILEGYYVQPVCSPTRSSLMTGRYTYRLGTQATVIRADVPFGVPLTETFVSQNMADAGYKTALFGKVRIAASCCPSCKRHELIFLAAPHRPAVAPRVLPACVHPTRARI